MKIGLGSKSLKDKLNQKVKEVLERYQPEHLPEDKEKAITKIIKRSEKRLLT
jgi:trimethylamine:corrinoid methyltransferase-like protein